jgi:hypothetical protein
MGFIALTQRVGSLVCDLCGHRLEQRGCSGMTERELCDANATPFFGSVELLVATAAEFAWACEQGRWRCSCCVVDAQEDEAPLVWTQP